MKHALVSVIIPFFNTPAVFLHEAVESVLGQSYRAWELLLVDDGSAGESGCVARQYARDYPEEVRYLEHSGHKNLGPSASRQAGIEHSRGEYVALLDADDVWLPFKLEQQVAILESQPEAGMLYGTTEYWHSWTGKPEDLERDHVPAVGIALNSLIEPPSLLPLFLGGRATVPCTCSVILRRDAVDRVGGFQDIHSFMYEDQMFYAKVCLDTPVFVSGQCWDKYRQHPDSGCSAAARTGLLLSSRLTYLRWLAQYMSAKGLTHPAVLQALQRQLWLADQPAWLAASPSAQHLLQLMKKQLLRAEERLLPAQVRRALWARPVLAQ